MASDATLTGARDRERTEGWKCDRLSLFDFSFSPLGSSLFSPPPLSSYSAAVARDGECWAS